MSNIVITTETPSDLHPEFQEKFGIGSIPLHVNLDGKDYRDVVDISAQQIYDTFKKKKVLPSTSAVAVGEYIDFFKKYLAEGKEIVHIAMSSGISSTYQNACIAAQDLESEGKIHVIDSRLLSQGTAILCYKAAEMAETGANAYEIIQAVEGMIPKLDNTFVITSLTFLSHGGRCSALEAFGANILKLKPLIDMKGGTMSVAKKYRGHTMPVYEQYIDDRLKDVDYDDEYVCLSAVLIDKERTDALIKKIKDEYHFKNVLLVPCSSVITSHGGKGAFGVFFLKK